VRIPKQIRIGGCLYTIEQVSPGALGGDCAANDITRSIIQINKDMPQDQKEVALFHEIIHAMNTNLSEEATEFLAQAFYQVLKENKLLK
jgi:Zn-dependent peptidase ImmA (M78 family)